MTHASVHPRQQRLAQLTVALALSASDLTVRCTAAPTAYAVTFILVDRITQLTEGRGEWHLQSKLSSHACLHIGTEFHGSKGLKITTLSQIRIAVLLHLYLYMSATQTKV